VKNPLFTVDTFPNPATMQKTLLFFSKNGKKMENTDNIILTPEAGIAIKSLMKEQNMDGKSLRVFVAGVG
jgi:hypothetical protein